MQHYVSKFIDSEAWIGCPFQPLWVKVAQTPYIRHGLVAILACQFCTLTLNLGVDTPAFFGSALSIDLHKSEGMYEILIPSKIIQDLMKLQ